MGATRDEARRLLEAWQAGSVTAPAVKAWAQAAVVEGDAVLAELQAELDLLDVYLLTAEDVPALVALLDGQEVRAALDAWLAYQRTIDLDARSKALKRDPFYRDFCR